MTRAIGNVLLEGYRLRFRNFAGEEGRFNAKGKRNFNVFLDNEIATQMEADGWNIRWLEPREEGDERQPTIKVNVHFGKNPPKIYLITSRGRTQLDESMISLLDWADIREVDMIVRPYQWDIQGKAGVTAYLVKMYVTIEEDELELKYKDVPDSAASAMMEPTEEGPPWEE